MGETSLQPAPRKDRHHRWQGKRANLYMAALALQYGAQPLLSKRCTGKTVIMTSTVLACEVVKVVFASLVLDQRGGWRAVLKNWSITDAFRCSVLPALLYAIQNTLLQLSYRHLDALTFSLLNQTKLVSTAVFMYLLLRYKQSVQQILALFLLLCAAAMLSFGQSSPGGSAEFNSETFVLGIFPVLGASVLSGLASTLCQWASQVRRRDPYLMTVEMSTFGSIALISSMLRSPDGEAIRTRGFFSGWTAFTVIPILSNAAGGILVGLVTSHSGGVKKGFVIVSALLVTALLQNIFDGIIPSRYCVIALPLVVSSTIIHHRYPFRHKKDD